MKLKCANLMFLEQHIHVLSYACFFCFFKRTLLSFQLNKIIATVLGGVDVYTCLCVYSTCVGERMQDADCSCVFDLKCVCVCMLTVCPSVLQRLVTFTRSLDVVPPGQCLLKQHHSLIFNNLLNSISWTRFCYFCV